MYFYNKNNSSSSSNATARIQEYNRNSSNNNNNKRSNNYYNKTNSCSCNSSLTSSSIPMEEAFSLPMSTSNSAPRSPACLAMGDTAASSSRPPLWWSPSPIPTQRVNPAVGLCAKRPQRAAGVRAPPRKSAHRENGVQQQD